MANIFVLLIELDFDLDKKCNNAEFQETARNTIDHTRILFVDASILKAIDEFEKDTANY